jgi:hypothetical protein
VVPVAGSVVFWAAAALAPIQRSAAASAVPSMGRVIEASPVPCRATMAARCAMINAQNGWASSLKACDLQPVLRQAQG